MVRQFMTAIFVAWLAIAGSWSAAAQESKAAAETKQHRNSVGMQLVIVPAGEFAMGFDEPAEAMAAFFNKRYGRDHRELLADVGRPSHRVRITRPFYLGIHHVTRGQFRQFVAETGYVTELGRDSRYAMGYDSDKKSFCFNPNFSWRNVGFGQTDVHPVVNVSWNDAVAFCKWLSEKEGKTYRLPTEAEWEFACRAGTKTRYSSGDDPESLAKVGNIGDATVRAQHPDWSETILASDAYVFTAPVGRFEPNAYGLFDMHGNAEQWCADFYGEGAKRDYYAISPVDDPPGQEVGAGHAIRGSSFLSAPIEACSAYRYGRVPHITFPYLGFRVAMDAQ